MRTPRLALTGPAAAALYGLDGYRDLTWPLRWVTPQGGTRGPNIIQSRWWGPTTEIGGVDVAPAQLVLRHLGDEDCSQPDGLATEERVELAVEHALRDGLVNLADLVCRGSRSAGDRHLRAILRVRGSEPPTESYAETRLAQLLRRSGLKAWRQLRIVALGGQILYRVDFALPASPRLRRPHVLRPEHGVILEVDGRMAHEPQFERDHDRDVDYRALGYRFVSVTPRQVERRPDRVVSAIQTEFRLAGWRTPTAIYR